MAAQTLLESGMKVLMLDGGMMDSKYKSLIPDTSYTDFRQKADDQYKILIGENLEGLNWGEVSTGAQLTPPRKFITDQVEIFLPLESNNFHPMESLALGGLGGAWGLGSCIYSPPELEKAGLNANKMHEAYRVVSDRIGISASNDDASPYTSGGFNYFLPELEIDSNAKSLYDKYKKKRNDLNRDGFFMGKPALALLTEDKGERKKCSYNDMDFYSDKDKSAYRPWITIEEMKTKYKNSFIYLGEKLVKEFSEENNFTTVTCIDMMDNSVKTYSCIKLVLASGVLGTARIVMRSVKSENVKFPILTNPYCYIPCIQPGMLGKSADQRRSDFAQLSLFHDPDKTNADVAMASIYSYHSLMLFRIIREAPLNFKDGRKMMRWLLPAMTIMGIHLPQQASEGKYLKMMKDENSPTGDKLFAEYSLNEEEKLSRKIREKKFLHAMRKLNCFAIKKIDPGFGSSIHYAGTLPFNDNEAEFTLNPSGRLNKFKNIFVADGSGFKYLPAKGLTFSLMANAHNVAKTVIEDARK